MLSDTDETDFNLAQYNPFRYKGYLWIPSTGFYYLNARFYDPTTGRFISEDPQGITPGDAGSFNAYAYADNNPLALEDPSGTMPVLQNGVNYSIAQPACDPNQPGSPCYDSTNDEVTPVPVYEDPVFLLTAVVGSAAGIAAAAGAGADVAGVATDAIASSAIKVIGRLADTEAFEGTSGYDVLNVANWTLEKIAAWVDDGIGNNQTFLMASEDNLENLWDTAKNRPTVFARELEQLLKAGYERVGNYLLPPR